MAVIVEIKNTICVSLVKTCTSGINSESALFPPTIFVRISMTPPVQSIN